MARYILSKILVRLNIRTKEEIVLIVNHFATQLAHLHPDAIGSNVEGQGVVPFDIGC